MALDLSSQSFLVLPMQVTGGNPGLLISAAADYNGDWESCKRLLIELGKDHLHAVHFLTQQSVLKVSSCTDCSVFGAALLDIWTPMLMDVQSAMSSRHPWTPLQFIAIASALLADDHHALQFSEAVLLLGSDGHQVLEAMVAATLLTYRPLSGMKRTWICSSASNLQDFPLKQLPKRASNSKPQSAALLL